MIVIFQFNYFIFNLISDFIFAQIYMVANVSDEVLNLLEHLLNTFIKLLISYNIYIIN